MFSTDIVDRATAVLARCRELGVHLVTAESCTGGLIAGALTEIAGSSDVVDCGFVTYSNGAKIDLLKVPADMLDQHGAVSEQVARAMAEGAMERAHASAAIAVTGIAGPGGGSADKPVGLVHIACARAEQHTLHQRCLFRDVGRARVRELTVLAALDLVLQHLQQPSLA